MYTFNILDLIWTSKVFFLCIPKNKSSKKSKNPFQLMASEGDSIPKYKEFG